MVKRINFIVKDYNYEKFMMMVILGTTGDSMDIEMNFFCTFWGLYILKKKSKPKVSNIPWRGIPMPTRTAATKVFKKRMKKYGIDDPWGIVKEAVTEGKMKLYPCTTTMELMGIKREQMLDYVEEPIGAAGFLEICDGADAIISL
jgi:peroxiredoxin family protein